MLPCNTLHPLLPILKKNSNVKIIDIIEEVSLNITKDYRIVGILGTTKTKEDKLYDKFLAKVETIYPNTEEQRELSDLILRIIRKQSRSKDKEYLKRLIENLKQKGAEKIIFACTDLSNLIKTHKDVIDSTQVLVNSILKEMRKPIKNHKDNS